MGVIAQVHAHRFAAPDPADLVVADEGYQMIVIFTDGGPKGADLVVYRTDVPDEVRQALQAGGREVMRRDKAGSLRSGNLHRVAQLLATRRTTCDTCGSVCLIEKIDETGGWWKHAENDDVSDHFAIVKGETFKVFEQGKR